MKINVSRTLASDYVNEGMRLLPMNLMEPTQEECLGGINGTLYFKNKGIFLYDFGFCMSNKMLEHYVQHLQSETKMSCE